MASARAETIYPSHPIRLIVPFAPGGATDVWARLVAEGLQADLGQPVVVENHAGSSGLVGAELVARAVPDGYTLLYNVTTHVQAPVVLGRPTYDPIDDFFFVGRLGTTALTFYVGPAVPSDVKTLADFLFWARGRELVFGNYGWGSTGHAFGVLLAQEARLHADQVVYPGEAPMLDSMLEGAVHGGFVSAVAAGNGIRSGWIRPLATGGPNRVPSLGVTVPLLFEFGFSNRFNFGGFSGLLAPAGIPRDVQRRLGSAFHRVATSATTIRRLQEIDTIPGYEGPDAFRASVQRTLWRWAELTESIGLRPRI